MESLVIPTVVTGIVGWLVKTLLDDLREYVHESKVWRTGMDSKVDAINDATQATMRTNLCHLYEKYMTRGWLTSEEHKAWHDMHEKYSALGENSLIDSYAAHIDQLPHREI